jgi:hypothetical protein
VGAVVIAGITRRVCPPLARKAQRLEPHVPEEATMAFRTHPTEAIWWTTAAVLLALFAITVVAWAFDKRMIDGASVWAKPMKFQLSLALHAATLALVVGTLSQPWRASWLLGVVAILVAAATAGEIAYIALQAMCQQRSHFNLSTPFYAAMYQLMALGAVVITVGAGIVGLVTWQDGEARLDASLRAAVGLGLLGGTILTLVTAFTIGSRLTPHVGPEPLGGARMALTGWSLVVGDLRVSHFLATHMVQAVPLFGLAASRLLTPRVAVAAVWVFALAWVVLTWLAYQQALAGRPLWRFSSAPSL